MSDNHNYSFFGKNTGMILSSSSKADSFFFLRCIMKKDNGQWEKPSQGEGKNVKFSLEEMICILQVLRKEAPSWSTYHSFKENSTQISFKWKNSEYKELYINVDNYPKMLTYAQIEVFKALLEHMFTEKIEFATSSNKISSKNEYQTKKVEYTNLEPQRLQVPKQEPPKPEFIKEPVIQDDKTEISGEVMGETQKAIFLKFSGEKEAWIPKSTIKSQYHTSKNQQQRFTIDTWVLKKNSIIA